MQLTPNEIARHNKPGDVWIINEGKVYDVSLFIDKHPGGDKIVLAYGGEDASAALKSKPHKHSPTAFALLRTYYIGNVNETLASDSLDDSGRPKRRTEVVEGEGENFVDWESDKLVDWNAPLIWQVGKLGEKYWDWVHAPVDRRVRLFKSDFLELLTCAPWWLIPLVWVPVLCVVIGRGIILLTQHDTRLPVFWRSDGLSITSNMFPVLFLAGFILWLFVEYVIHRWIFHFRTENYYAIMLHFSIHGLHHKDPLNKIRLVFPPLPAMLFAIPLISFFTMAFPVAIGYCVLAGFMSGYILYDLMHYYLHHGTPFTRYLNYFKQYHMRHHFEDPNLGFGVSSPLVDFIFGTQLPPLDKFD